MKDKPLLALAVLLLGVGGLQMVWAALSSWTGAQPKESAAREVQSEVRLVVEANQADKIRLLFPELPLAIDHRYSSEALRIPVKFRADTSPTRVQVQVWSGDRVVLQSQALTWSGGPVVNLGKPQLSAP